MRVAQAESLDLVLRTAGESELNLQLMRLIDEQYLRTPFYGWPRMTAGCSDKATRSTTSVCND